jgi:hypothetical protein
VHSANTLHRLYHLIGVDDRCRPVEALAESLSYEGTRSGVVTAFAHVNVPVSSHPSEMEMQ